MLLVDADLYLFRAVAATEDETDWGDDIWSLTTDLKLAKELFFDQLDTFKEQMGDDDVILCLSDSSNFRRTVDPTYKGNRKKTRKPVGYKALVEWASITFKTFKKQGLEADDCLGILATKPENKGKCVVISDDKDLKTIPCKLYRPISNERLTVSPEEADRFFYMQCLTGDTADGYAGLKGVGPKTAEKILGSRPAWSLVEQAYLKAGMTREDALTQARLARILRWEDWDAKKDAPILWTGDVAHAA
jgi:DNA polymerase-1